MNRFATCLNIKHENIQIIQLHVVEYGTLIVLDSDIKLLFVTIHHNGIRRTVVSEVTSYFPLQSRQLTMGAITIPLIIFERSSSSNYMVRSILKILDTTMNTNIS